MIPRVRETVTRRGSVGGASSGAESPVPLCFLSLFHSPLLSCMHAGWYLFKYGVCVCACVGCTTLSCARMTSISSEHVTDTYRHERTAARCAFRHTQTTHHSYSRLSHMCTRPPGPDWILRVNRSHKKRPRQKKGTESISSHISSPVPPFPTPPHTIPPRNAAQEGVRLPPWHSLLPRVFREEKIKNRYSSFFLFPSK